MKEDEEVIRNRLKNGCRENEGKRGSNKKQGD